MILQIVEYRVYVAVILGVPVLLSMAMVSLYHHLTAKESLRLDPTEILKRDLQALVEGGDNVSSDLQVSANIRSCNIQ